MDLEVEGYDFCRCGEWVLAGQKLCGACASQFAEAVDEVLTLDVDGEAVPLRPHPRKPHAQGEGKGDRGMERRARDRARTRAWIRLARIYEPMFAAIYWEEQIREGIEPMPLPPLSQDPTEGLIRDIEEFRERLEATFDGGESTLDASA